MHLSLAHVIPWYSIALIVITAKNCWSTSYSFVAVAWNSSHMERCLELLHWQTAPRVSHFSASLYMYQVQMFVICVCVCVCVSLSHSLEHCHGASCRQIGLSYLYVLGTSSWTLVSAWLISILLRFGDLHGVNVMTSLAYLTEECLLIFCPHYYWTSTELSYHPTEEI